AAGSETSLLLRRLQNVTHELRRPGDVLAGLAVEVRKAGADPGQVVAALRLTAHREIAQRSVQALRLTLFALAQEVLNLLDDGVVRGRRGLEGLHRFHPGAQVVDLLLVG